MLSHLTFSTWLTLLRIALAPCVMTALYFQAWLVAAVIFIIAASTDFFDGYYARLYHQETQLGKILDPIADKILLIATMISLCASCKQTYIPLWFIMLFAGKDLLLVCGAVVLLHYKKSSVMNPSLFSKCLTAGFMIFLLYCIVLEMKYMTFDITGPLILLFAISTVVIFLDYSLKFYRLLKE